MTTSSRKIVVESESLHSRIQALARPLVFTNGCFDLLHRGHVDYLERAAEFGASLVVGINSDDSIRRLGKGTERPLNPLADRAAVLAALASVDLVVAFDDDTPLQLILAIRPDHLVKGGDWPLERIIGANEVRAWGGQAHSLPFRYERSTTGLLERIRHSSANPAAAGG